MAKYRNPYPNRVVWLHVMTHTRFYWLAADPELQEERAMVIARIEDRISLSEAMPRLKNRPTIKCSTDESVGRYG